MGLMFANCKPQPNCMPRNPKLMFQICQKLRRGFSRISFLQSLESEVWSLESKPLVLTPDSRPQTPDSSRIDVDVFEHDVAVERERVHERLRHVRDVDEAGARLLLQRGVLHVNEAGAEVEDADVR